MSGAVVLRNMCYWVQRDADTKLAMNSKYNSKTRSIILQCALVRSLANKHTIAPANFQFVYDMILGTVYTANDNSDWYRSVKPVGRRVCQVAADELTLCRLYTIVDDILSLVPEPNNEDQATQLDFIQNDIVRIANRLELEMTGENEASLHQERSTQHHVGDFDELSSREILTMLALLHATLACSIPLSATQ
jgi:hypothetical protein